jgi:hypothetical protein
MLKTNMMMEVKINQDLSFMIGHKTKMGKVDTILHHGNMLREQRGLRPITMNNILKKSDFWEFVIARNTQNYIKTQTAESALCKYGTATQTSDSDVCISSDYSILNEYKDRHGELQYSELVKQFPLLIKSQRGGKVENRGYWMDLHLLLKLASILDKDLEVQIYDIFINGQILENRDRGGEAFKALNDAIDTLPDRLEKAKKRNISIVKNNKHVYRHISDEVQKALGTYDNGSHGYNEEEHSSEVQKNRATLLDFLTNGIKFKMITSYPQLKEVIRNFTF